METRRLQVLLELSRLRSMRAVAERLGTTTSGVSQQIARLAQETGTALVEPDGRRVRLTPAGRRLAEHAARILEAVEAARVDLDPRADPAGTVRVAGFATAIRRTLLPIVAGLATTHPAVRVLVHEYEPAEALALLTTGDVDLALTYDYDLAPAPAEPRLRSRRLWSTPWGLGVPADAATAGGGTAPEVFGAFRDADWIGNSRNRADEDVVRLVASMAGFEPRVAHQADSLELVEDLVLAGLGVGLLPADRPPRPGIAVLPLTDPGVRLRAYVRTARGRSAWPPLALILQRLTG
ncbi:MAG TPA: LysR family transcriptional regulator [Geodermatophilus sp.]|nr:LysR family transcriptional regulator [Geodermatophilus sp.]